MTSTTEAGIAPEAQVDAPQPAEERSSARAWYVLMVLIIAMMFGYVNRQILTLLVQPIKADLSLTDLQIGETHGLAPAIFAAIAIYPMAWVADRAERRTVLAVCIIFWSIATAASGLAWNFLTLQACTIAIVVGEIGGIPIIYSLIPDLFPPKSRPRANMIVYAATVLGAGLGLALGGGMISVIDDLRPLLPASLNAYESWRLAFFLVALPGPLIALAVFMTGRTPRKVVVSKNPAATEGMGSYAKAYGLVAFGVYGAMGLFNFAGQGLGTWMPIAIIRTFKVDPASVGVNFGICFMAGAVVGLILAAILTPYYRRIAGTAFVLRALSFSAIGVVLPLVLLPFTTEIWQAYALVASWPIIFIPGVSLMPGLMQEVAPAALRTRIIALGYVVFMIGGAISSPLIGFISDQATGSAKGLMWAMVAVSVPGFLACAFLSRFMEAPYRRTVAAIGND